MDPQPEAFVIDDVRFSFTNEGSGWTTGVTIRSDDGADLGAVVGYLLNEIDEQDVPAFLPRVVVRQVEFERAADGALRLSSLIALPEGLAIDLRRLPLVPDTLDDDYQIEFTGLGVELVRPAGGEWAARFSGELRFGGKPETLRLPIAADRTLPEPQIVPAERTFGPLSVDSLTVDFDGGKLRVRLNARLGRAGLLIEVIGLRVSIPLATPLDPEFAIDGLAVTYDIPPVKISGGLLVVAHPDYEQFDGSLTVRAGEFGLTALGSYAASAPPSLFAFLQVLAPIGGPPAFYVAGVAGGFGINRRLELPAIEKLEVFPLIQGSRTEAPFTRGAPVGSSIALLNEYMSPLDGRDWVVAGIDVASFGVLRTSALLTLAFGGRVEIGLLGLATLRFPPVGPQVVHARLALRTAVSPAVGELSVRGQLTADSYVLDPDCRLTGGFALCFWFAPHPQGGDFVITLGGYHPGFDVPGHYPAVPRLGVSWAPPLLPLTVKGTHYFALTPALVMTGGVLEANWDVDPIRARFTIQADLVARWAPFHYDLTVGVTFGVDARLGALARHTMSLTVGAELKLWGPRFSGRAHVDLGVMGFTIEFGDAPELEAVPALDWDEFRTSVLGDQTLRLEVRDGLLATAEAGPRVVDPERLVLAAETAVPIKELSVNGHAREIEAERDFGIGPMEIGCDALSSTCAITVQRLDGTPYGGVEVEELATCGPRALWAPAPPSLDAEPTLRGLVTGLRLTPEGAEGHRIKAHPVGRTQPGRGPTWQRRAALEGPVARAHGGDARAVIAHSLTDPAVAAERARIIAAHLGADFAPDLSGALLLRAEPVLEGLEDDD